MNALKLLEIYIEKIRSKYRNDISIIFYTGSYLTRTTHEKSDLDVIFIPSTKRGYKPSIRFILDDIGFDFFPMSWEWIHDLTAQLSAFSTVLLNSKVVYYRNRHDLNKFNAYKKQILKMYKSNLSGDLLIKAADKIKECYFFLNNIKLIQNSSKSITSVHVEANKIISNIVDALSIVNQFIYNRTWNKEIEVFNSFKYLPENFSDRILSVIKGQNSGSIYKTLNDLLDDTMALINHFSKKVFKNTLKPIDCFKGYYEEAKSLINRIIIACGKKDYYNAYFTIQSLQYDTSTYLAAVENNIHYSGNNIYDDYSKVYINKHFPDLIKTLLRKDFNKLKQDTLAFEQRMISYLQANKIDVLRFSDISQYEDYIRKKL